MSEAEEPEHLAGAAEQPLAPGLYLVATPIGNLGDLKDLVELAKSGALRPSPIERVPHARPNLALDRVRCGDVAGRLVLQADGV